MNTPESILNERRAGVLLHITSLPGQYDQGDLGKEAYHFVDFLQNTGASVWQTLPLGMPHGDGSPYQCLSTHAGNPSLISMEWLIEKKWLESSELDPYINTKTDLRQAGLKIAFTNFMQRASAEDQKEFDLFCKKQSWWLDDFALFIALKKEFDQAEWSEWPDHFKHRDLGALNKIQKLFSNVIDLIRFKQFVFFRQWDELRQYAHQHGVNLFGDIPIFVAYDSSDVWAQRENFKLDDQGEMSVVAGVPPDYFSATGQRWGNPHYNWSYLQRNDFKWWLERIKSQLEMFDIIRIDHFRGLEAAWEIPADQETAIEGQWVTAPGEELLSQIRSEFGYVPLVAEDLGIITPEVEELRDQFDLPGMKILQFAFDGGSDNPYLPHNHETNSVVYTGTHDNDTTLGWFNTHQEHEKVFIYQCLGDPKESMPGALIKAAMASVSHLAIIPMQDILELDSEHRMNTPGSIENNWHWRFDWSQLKDDMVSSFAHLVGFYDRKR